MFSKQVNESFMRYRMYANTRGRRSNVSNVKGANYMNSKVSVLFYVLTRSLSTIVEVPSST